MQDFHYALRVWGRTPALTAIIVLSLAIGIGANTAIFSVADALLLRPLPYPDAERIVHLWLRSPGSGIQQDWPSPGEYLDIKSQNHVLEQMAISLSYTFVMTGRGTPERLEGFFTSSALFPLLGARTILGQTFGPRQDSPGDQFKAVITDGLWIRLFGGDPRIVGKTITLDGRAFVVVGVLAREFTLDHDAMPPATVIDRAEIFAPLPLGPNAVNRRFDENYNVTARLRPGVTLREAQAEIGVIADRIRVKDRRDPTFTIVVVPMLEQITGSVRRVVYLLLGSVGLVLLIACANVANLLLSRTAAREKEMAIRAASGATRWRLIRQLMSESMMLSMAGGAGGLLLAFSGIELVRLIQPGNIPRVAEIGLNGSVLAFTFFVSLLTGIAFGAAPALRISGADLNACLKSGGRGLRSGMGSDHLRNVLVTGELALSLILLIGAGLLLRSFFELQKVPPGFNPEHVLSARVSLRGKNYPHRENLIRFFDALHTRLAGVPGIDAEATTSSPPLSGTLAWRILDVEGYTPPPDQPEMQADMRTVSPDYFKVMQIPLLQGRPFDSGDTLNSPGVAIVDRALARRFWPRGDALGKRVRFRNRGNVWLNVVAVAGTVKHDGLETEPRPTVYLPNTQLTLMDMYVVARTANDPLAAAPAFEREIHAVDPDVPIYSIATGREGVARSLARRRFTLTALGGFGAFALVLAAIGVYGVMSFLVTQSTHDIGVRMALGAKPGNILSMVVMRGLRLFGFGLALGLTGAFALSRLMEGLLFRVSATDPLVFASVSVFLGITAMLACYLPARRAASVDPATALRQD